MGFDSSVHSMLMIFTLPSSPLVAMWKVFPFSSLRYRAPTARSWMGPLWSQNPLVGTLYLRPALIILEVEIVQVEVSMGHYHWRSVRFASSQTC